MPAPLQHIHGQDRRVGHLHKENLVAGDLRDATRVALERQGVEAVEQHTEAWVIDLAHQVPHLLPGVHMLAPRQGFIADAQAALARVFGQQAQVIEQNTFVTHAVGRGIAAHQYQIGAQFLHQIEFAFGTLQVACQAITAAAFEVAKRLEQGDGDAQVGAHLPDFPRAAVVIQQVVLKDLHPIKPGGGDGFEFFRQGAAQGHSGNRTLHGRLPAIVVCGKLFAPSLQAAIKMYEPVSFWCDYRTLSPFGELTTF